MRQVTEQLHMRHKLVQEKRNKAKNDEISQIEVQRKKLKANKASNQIVNNAKVTKFQEIFYIMDHDGDGLISTTKMNLHTLDSKLVDVLKPLLEELEQLAEPLNQSEFVDACLRLYETLNAQEKSIVLKFGH